MIFNPCPTLGTGAPLAPVPSPPPEELQGRRVQSLGAKAEEQNAAATIAEITLAVDQAFYSVLETKALVTVAEQTVSSRQLLVDKIKALTDAKLKSDLDLSFTRVDLARGKLLLLEAKNNYEASLAALSAILGYPDEQKFQLVRYRREVPISLDPNRPRLYDFGTEVKPPRCRRLKAVSWRLEW